MYDISLHDMYFDLVLFNPKAKRVYFNRKFHEERIGVQKYCRFVRDDLHGVLYLMFQRTDLGGRAVRIHTGIAPGSFSCRGQMMKEMGLLSCDSFVVSPKWDAEVNAWRLDLNKRVKVVPATIKEVDIEDL